MFKEGFTYIANWKGRGAREVAHAWVAGMEAERQIVEARRVIVCPPFSALYLVTTDLEQRGLDIPVGAQDMAIVNEIKSTGQELPELLVDSGVKFVILGHTETRRIRRLTDEDVATQIILAEEHNLRPIVCVANLEQVVALENLGIPKDFDDFIVYEPPSAIGTGQPDTPENANKMAGQILDRFPNASVGYGGSVTPENIEGFEAQENLSAVLIGDKSSGSTFFLEILKHEAAA